MKLRMCRADRWKICLLLIPLSIGSLVFPLASQQPLVGVIQGTIKDQSGKPIAEVGLTATNIDSVDPESHRRLAATDKKGFYQFADVPEGHYSIVAKKRGYRDFIVPSVIVRGGQTVQMMDIKMSSTGRRSGSAGPLRPAIAVSVPAS